MNTQTIPIIAFFTLVVGLYYAAAVRRCKTPAELTIAKLTHFLIAAGFAVVMLFFTKPH